MPSPKPARKQTPPQTVEQSLVFILEMLKRHEKALSALDADVQAILTTIDDQHVRSFEQSKQRALQDAAQLHDHTLQETDEAIDRWQHAPE
jgi:hypothetical protein